MGKDLIIGGASNYDWNKIKHWVNSIKRTGFEGDVVICATNIKKETVSKLSDANVKVYLYGKETETGYESITRTAPHVERFFHIWNYLSQNTEDYRFVVVTDVRDVIFQTNPVPFLEKNLVTKSIVCSSEGLAYKNEPWGSNNFLEAFGPFFYDVYKETTIYNVGTIAGYNDEVRDLLLILFQLSINRPIPVVDQAVFNFMINQVQYESETLKTTNKDNWAIQLGTTKVAIESGSGDIGIEYKNNPSKIDEYNKIYNDVQPTVNGHEVLNPSGEKYCIVHQWDRVDGLREAIDKEYGDV